MSDAVHLYRPFIVGPSSASEILGSLWLPNFYLPTTLRTARLIKGCLQFCDERGMYTGTEGEIDDAIEVLRRQIAEPLKTQEEVCGTPAPWGASFRIRYDEGDGAVFQAAQGEGLPVPPWEFRMIQREDDIWLQYRTEGGALWFDMGKMKG